QKDYSGASSILYSIPLNQLKDNNIRLLYLSMSNYLLDLDFSNQVNCKNYLKIISRLETIVNISFSEQNIDSLVLSRVFWYLGLLDNRFVSKSFSHKERFEQALFLAREAGQELELARHQRILCEFELGIIAYKNQKFDRADAFCRDINLDIVTAPQMTLKLEKLDVQNKILKSNILFQRGDYKSFEMINNKMIVYLDDAISNNIDLQFSYSDVMDNFIEKNLIIGDYSKVKELFTAYNKNIKKYDIKIIDTNFLNQVTRILEGI
ncbi:MAG: hypothetical protein KAG14_04575, partial [Mycoplasmataceae bacterium]|nr:hypothetical protein [Mycoplasmataceae bacterium]